MFIGYVLGSRIWELAKTGGVISKRLSFKVISFIPTVLPVAFEPFLPVHLAVLMKGEEVDWHDTPA